MRKSSRKIAIVICLPCLFESLNNLSPAELYKVQGEPNAEPVVSLDNELVLESVSS